MASRETDKLGKFLREVSNWSWDAFARAEKDMQYSSREAIIFALIRACVMQQMQAIKVAVSRLDGKLKTPIKIEYPKIYYLYPNAKPSEWIGPDSVMVRDLDVGAPEVDYDKPPEKLTDDAITEQNFNTQDEAVNSEDLPSMGMRETLAMMADYPRELPEAIIALALQTEQWIRKQAERPSEIPKVKSVVAAHLLVMGQNRNLDAISEIFDSIDGKLVETLQVLGEDIYLTSFSDVAPPDAVVNKDGILQAEATQVQDLWATRLGKELK